MRTAVQCICHALGSSVMSQHGLHGFNHHAVSTQFHSKVGSEEGGVEQALSPPESLAFIYGGEIIPPKLPSEHYVLLVLTGLII